MTTRETEAKGRSDVEHLLGASYEEFRRIARRVLGGQGDVVHIQPTELVHEAAMRILAADRLSVRDQSHFMALCVRVMRTTLIDEIRRRKAAKRGSDVVTGWKENEQAPEESSPIDVEAFDDALERLAAVDAEAARIVELRFYAGMTVEEIAAALDMSDSTVHRRWRTARAWLFRELQVDG